MQDARGYLARPLLLWQTSCVKRVLIFSLAYFPKHVGGAEFAIKEITDRIDFSDIEFHMVTLRFDSTLPIESKEGVVTVHRIGWGKKGAGMGDTFTLGFYFSKIFFIPLVALKAARLHRALRFDAAWAMMAYMQFPIVLARLLGMRIPYAITLQEGDPFQHVFQRWYILPFRPLLVYGFRHASVIQTISTFLAGWARQMGFFGPLEVIPNGVNTEHFSQEYRASIVNEIKDTLEKKMGDVFVITTSRLVHKNAVDDVIRALPLLPGNVHFVVLGIGPDEAKLKKLAADLKVSERMRFLGQIGHADLPKYLKASDIFIRASRSEGMGNSFVEAMAAGIPVIATQEGGPSDFLFDEKRNPDQPITGWAVDKDSPPQTAAAIKDIMARPEKVRAVVATAKQMVIEKYDWNLVAKDMREKVFERLFA